MRAILLVLFSTAILQAALQPPQTIRLWDGSAPGALGAEDGDIPTLTVYLPFGTAKDAVVSAVVICPGGGYGALADNHEGRQVANWFNSLGMTAFVLKYRLGPRYHHPVELGDAQRAVRLVRARAQSFGVNPQQIGILGFSAGGHLAATVETHADDAVKSPTDPIDQVSSRPNFAVLCYPVISFTTPYTHKGSMKSLLGDNPDAKLVESLSAELQVTSQTPPTFLFHTDADSGVPAENSVLFYLALRKNHVPAELHIFEKGPHGVGLALQDPTLSQWPTLLANWLRGRGLLK